MAREDEETQAKGMRIKKESGRKGRVRLGGEERRKERNKKVYNGKYNKMRSRTGKRTNQATNWTTRQERNGEMGK